VAFLFVLLVTSSLLCIEPQTQYLSGDARWDKDVRWDQDGKKVLANPKGVPGDAELDIISRFLGNFRFTNGGDSSLRR
jgi:hypothetical protein